jgi:hypothetical protein
MENNEDKAKIMAAQAVAMDAACIKAHESLNPAIQAMEQYMGAVPRHTQERERIERATVLARKAKRAL